MSIEYTLKYTGAEIDEKLGQVDINKAGITQLAADVAAEKAERISAINAEEAERKREIAVERSRIDTFVALPEGSTYNEAELEDIRVAYDGTTYDTAGNAVREQIGRLSEEIADLTGGTYSPIEPKDDDIPKVFFSEAIPQTKTDTVTEFRYISKTKDISGYAEFKAQGNSSLQYPKKNMTVKMYKDEALTDKLKVDFKGWGEQRKHVYKANWIDLTHARNIVSARIWSDVVKSRADYGLLPELYRTSANQGAVDGFPVKVYAQGIYQGRYTLNIPKDAWMANMDDELDEHCILCGENYVSGCFRAPALINGSDWSDEVHGTVPTTIKTRWNEIISFVMNSTDEEFKANLGNYFFVDSLIDYLIFGVVSCGLDAFGKNQLYFTYDGSKWIAVMYDMDSTWGLWWNGSTFVSADYSRGEFQDMKDGEGNLLYIRLLDLFTNEIKARWNELKKDVLSIPNLINHFERFTDIAPLDLIKEDYASTTGGGKFTGIPQQSTNNIQQIRKYIIDRLAYCETYFASIGENGGEVEPDIPENPEAILTSISAVYIGGDVEIGTALNSLTGITVTAHYSDGTTANVTGYTLSGTIAEGTNTITVSYGGKTTTFTVTGVSESGGNEPDVDYELEPFANVEWHNGYKYGTGTEMIAASGEHCTDRIVNPQSCCYKFTGPQWTGVYVWDENDKYLCRLECNVANVDKYIVIPKDYKMALKTYSANEPDVSSILFKPVDNHTLAYKEIALSELTWKVVATNAIEASYDLTGCTVNMIDSSNYPILPVSSTSDVGDSEGLLFGMYSITALLANHKDYPAEQLIEYFNTNNVKLILNERQK